MTVDGKRRGLVVGTWAAVAAVPVGWVAGVLLVFLGGEGRPAGAGSVVVGLAGVVVFAAVPAVAVALAGRLRHTGQASGRAAVVVSGCLLALTLVATVLVGPLATITVVVLMTVLILIRRRLFPASRSSSG